MTSLHLRKLNMQECVLPRSCCRDDENQISFHCRFNDPEPKTLLGTTSDFIKWGPRPRTPPRCEPVKRLVSLSEGDPILPVEGDSGADSLVATEWNSVFLRQQSTISAFPWRDHGGVNDGIRRASLYEPVFKIAQSSVNEKPPVSPGSSTSESPERCNFSEREYLQLWHLQSCESKLVLPGEFYSSPEASPRRQTDVANNVHLDDNSVDKCCARFGSLSCSNELTPLVRRVLDDAYIAAASRSALDVDHCDSVASLDSQQIDSSGRTKQTNEEQVFKAAVAALGDVQSSSHRKRRAGSLPDIMDLGSPRSRTGCAPLSSKLEKFRSLENFFAKCEMLLCDFEKDAGTMDSQSRLKQFSAYKDLARQIEICSAEALEMGCGRDMAGAMDLFEQANVALERIANLLDVSMSQEQSVDSEPSVHVLSTAPVPCWACFDYLRLPWAMKLK